jgi:hypothetical protein
MIDDRGSPASAPMQSALVQSPTVGSDVVFLTTYDGTGWVDHRIINQGVFSVDGQRIEGAWTIPHSWSGSISLVWTHGVAAGR